MGRLALTAIAVIIFVCQAPFDVFSGLPTARYDRATFSVRNEHCSRVGGSASSGNASHIEAEWKKEWIGKEFFKYKKEIDYKIRTYRNESWTKNNRYQELEMPLYAGEFGYELAGVIPWVYFLSKKHDIKTQGRPGTKYLYYFSREHKIKATKKPGESQRKSHRLPKESPFGESPHFGIDKFPKERWIPPPYKDFFKPDDDVVKKLFLEKPLLILSNKYTMEWSSGPVNHIPLQTLREILTFLSPHYHIVYNRFDDARLADKLESKISSVATMMGHSDDVGPYDDKEMIRYSFPNVVLLEELTQSLEPDDVNLLLLSLGSIADKFISVQGGNSVVNSFFGGTNIIYCVRGPETNYTSDTGGDFSYYHKFSNATIVVAENAFDFCNAVKKYTIGGGNFDNTSGCPYCSKPNRAK